MTTAQQNPSKIILGIDPGTNVMGYGVIRVHGNKAEMVVMGVIDMRREKDVYLRLGKVFERVTSIIETYLPDEMAIEAPFFGKNITIYVEVRASTRGGYCSRNTTRCAHTRICPIENKNGNNRQWFCF